MPTSDPKFADHVLNAVCNAPNNRASMTSMRLALKIKGYEMTTEEFRSWLLSNGYILRVYENSTDTEVSV